MSFDKQISFQNSFSINFDNIIYLHHFVFCFLISILIFVFSILYMIIKPNLLLSKIFMIKQQNKFVITEILLKTTKTVHASRMELVWTMIPALIIASLLMPSFNLLYGISDFTNTPDLIVKIIGHQWYWTYEYSIYFLDPQLFYDSLKNINTWFLNKETKILQPVDLTWTVTFITDSEIQTDSKIMFKLLEADNFLIIPEHSYIKFLVTSDDVIHSFAIPSLGVKIDAIPGRLNETILYTRREGLYYGQCSEICGINHAFMPISILVLSKNTFFDTLLNSLRI